MEIKKELEVWKNLNEFDDKYEISTYGRIKSKVTNDVLKQSLTSKGYYTVSLHKNNKSSIYKYVHELVAINFIKNELNYKYVIHKDGNIHNNYYTNLEFIDCMDNTRDYRKKKTKQIFQYDLEYIFIKKWNSLEEILKENQNFKMAAVANNICNISKSAYKYIWSYDENLTKPNITEEIIINTNYFIENNVYEYPEDKEYWKDIIGYESRYKISNYGNIYSKQLNKLFSPNKSKGHYSVKLIDENQKSKTFDVHRLVANSFIQNPNNYNVVHHIDRNKFNNFYKNLKWCSRSETSKIRHEHNAIILQYDLQLNILMEWINIQEVINNNDNFQKKKL